MARIESLSLLNSDSGKEYLSELYGKVIENVMARIVSGSMKNTDLSGDPTSGTVEAKRFVNAQSQKYGTARAASKGVNVKAKPVTVAIDQDCEIVEEIAKKDTKLYGVDGLLEKRAANHVLRMVAELDSAFFKCAADAASAVSLDASMNIRQKLEKLIQTCANTKNDFVDGVEREFMHLVLSSAYYGEIRNELDTNENSNVDTSAPEFHKWHGVETKECVRLPEGVDAILMVTGAVAQPVTADPYAPEKIPLSNDFAVSLFYSYGTKAVTPDLIYKIVKE